jgi:hypothetical protein
MGDRSLVLRPVHLDLTYEPAVANRMISEITLVLG